MVSTAVQAQSVRIVFSSDRNEEDQYYDIWKMKEDGSNPTQVTNEEGDARNPSVSLDAKYTVYDLAGDLYLKSSGNDPVNLTGGSANPCADG